MNSEEETMSRREMREQVFKLLFRVEFNDEDAMQQQKELYEIVRMLIVIMN